MKDCNICGCPQEMCKCTLVKCKKCKRHFYTDKEGPNDKKKTCAFCWNKSSE